MKSVSGPWNQCRAHENVSEKYTKIDIWACYRWNFGKRKTSRCSQTLVLSFSAKKTCNFSVPLSCLTLCFTRCVRYTLCMWNRAEEASLDVIPKKLLYKFAYDTLTHDQRLHRGSRPACHWLQRPGRWLLEGIWSHFVQCCNTSAQLKLLHIINLLTFLWFCLFEKKTKYSMTLEHTYLWFSFTTYGIPQNGGYMHKI